MRSSIVQTLEQFYEDEGLRPGSESFRCKHKADCMRDPGVSKLAQGAEAHVGSKYGDRFRLVVVSIDAAGGASCMSERRDMIERGGEPDNPHMRGTREIVQAFFPDIEGTQELFARYAMTNAAKCSRRESSSAVPYPLYERCRDYARRELALLKPDIVVSQGVRAREVLTDFAWLSEEQAEDLLMPFRPSDQSLLKWAKATIREYVLKQALADGKSCWAIQSPHPSARGGQWQRFARMALPLVAAAVAKRVCSTA